MRIFSIVVKRTHNIKSPTYTLCDTFINVRLKNLAILVWSFSVWHSCGNSIRKDLFNQQSTHDMACLQFFYEDIVSLNCSFYQVIVLEIQVCGMIREPSSETLKRGRVCNPTNPTSMCRLADVVVYMQEAKWGDISMCDAERRLLANALLDYDNERFVLLSETCAPLWNFTFSYNYLIKSHYSFVGVFDDPGPFGRGRYNERMLPEVTLQQWRKGAQWFEVNRELAIYIISDMKYYPKFQEFCRPACYVDEHYIPTMMYIEFAAQLANRSLTAVDWSRGGSHPGIYGHHDAQQYLNRIRGDQGCMYNAEPGHICFLFARKFAPNSLGPLLQHSSF
jgi:hypothetical protein